MSGAVTPPAERLREAAARADEIGVDGWALKLMASMFRDSAEAIDRGELSPDDIDEALDAADGFMAMSTDTGGTKP